MKKVVECQKEFFAYFNALETRGVPIETDFSLSILRFAQMTAIVSKPFLCGKILYISQILPLFDYSSLSWDLLAQNVDIGAYNKYLQSGANEAK